MGLFGTLGSAAGGVVGGIYGGPWGAAAGSAAGGYLGSQLDPKALEEGGMSDADKAYYAQVRSQQNALAEQLRLQASGQGPNPAVLQAQRAGDQAIKQNQGFVASQKGMNPALAQRLAAQNQAHMGQEIAGQSAELQARQQLAAQQQLAALLSGQSQQEVAYRQMQQQLLMSRDQQNANMFGGLLNGAGAAASQYYSRQPSGTNQTTGGETSPTAGAKMISEPQVESSYGGGNNMTVHPYAYSQGGHVPGKAQVSGDSSKNDNVVAMLSPGEIVIPRSAAKNPKLAKEFIDQIMKKEKAKDIGYEDIMAMKRKKA